MQNNKLSRSLLSLCCISLCLVACGEKKNPPEQVTPEATSSSSAPPPVASKVPTAFDGHPGKGIHDANCISCHDTKVYMRPERKVLDYTQLVAQVQRCDANLDTRLSSDELAKLTDYLNQAFYQYTP